MEKRYEVAAWMLLGLLAAGVVVPPLVLSILQPQTVQEVAVHINGTLPLDAFFLLDASRSLSDESWNLALDFARGMGKQLQAKLPQLRAGMGQFADLYGVIHPLSEDLSAWESAKEVDRLEGHTQLAHGLCGNAATLPLTSCPGGAYGELAGAPPANVSSLKSCGVARALQKIIVVTDGVPAGPELAVAAARMIKASGNVTIMGILAQGTGGDLKDNMAELYALTSCCAARDTEAVPGRWKQNRPACAEDMNESCPDLVTRTDYSALVASADALVAGLQQEMDCTITVMSETVSTDWSVLWFLLLLAPMLIFLCWQNLLLCLSKTESVAAEVGAGLSRRSAEMELSTELSSATQELEAATAAVAAAEAMMASGQPSVAQTATGETEAAGGAGEAGAAAGAMPGFGGEAGEGPGADGASSPIAVGASGSDAEAAGARMSSVGETASGGRKWAPVRTAYIVNGQRVNVDYGHGLPPAAQLGAHRGMDEWNQEQDGAMAREPSAGGPELPHGPSRQLSRQLTREMTRQLTRQLTESLEHRMAGLPEEVVAPPLRRYNCSVALPLVCTVLLLPLVVWKSGILHMVGLVQ